MHLVCTFMVMLTHGFQQHMDKPEPEEQVEDWYSSEEEDEPKKKEKENKSKTEISDKISSVLNQIRQQSQPKTSSPSSLPLPPISDSKPPSFYGDTDFRSQPSSFKDIDLRNPSSMFKKIDIEPAKEINASLTFNGPITYKVKKVLGIPKIDYSSVRMGLPPSSIVLDPRLGPKRNNSMPAPASPTETSAPDIGIQPLTIPDGTPVFDPRTSRGGGNSGRGGGGPPGITPQQNNPFLDSDNRFVRLVQYSLFPLLFDFLILILLFVCTYLHFITLTVETIFFVLQTLLLICVVIFRLFSCFSLLACPIRQ